MVKAENLKEKLQLIKLQKNPDLYVGSILFGLTHPEEMKIVLTFNEREREMAWKATLLLSRIATKSLLRFTENQKILTVFDEQNPLTFEEINGRLNKNGFKIHGELRRNMVATLIDFLYEVKMIQKISDENSEKFILSKSPIVDYSLSKEEEEYCHKNYGGSINFFEVTTNHASNVLKGEKQLFNFEKKHADIWEKFLESKELEFGRKFTLKAMRIKNSSDYKILDIGYARGYGLLNILELFPEINVWAIDFTDDYLKEVKNKVSKFSKKNSANKKFKINWVDSSKWQNKKVKGFGANLPFKENFFDGIFFAAGDPFIPIELRHKVYEDIFRILKPGGTLGLMSWHYPDKEQKIVKDSWMRRIIYRHNFAESVVEGWSGFHNLDETVKMFKEIGFTTEGFQSNKYYLYDGVFWRLRKPANLP